MVSQKSIFRAVLTFFILGIHVPSFSTQLLTDFNLLYEEAKTQTTAIELSRNLLELKLISQNILSQSSLEERLFSPDFYESGKNEITLSHQREVLQKYGELLLKTYPLELLDPFALEFSPYAKEHLENIIGKSDFFSLGYNSLGKLKVSLSSQTQVWAERQRMASHTALPHYKQLLKYSTHLFLYANLMTIRELLPYEFLNKPFPNALDKNLDFIWERFIQKEKKSSQETLVKLVSERKKSFPFFMTQELLKNITDQVLVWKIFQKPLLNNFNYEDLEDLLWSHFPIQIENSGKHIGELSEREFVVFFSSLLAKAQKRMVFDMVQTIAMGQAQNEMMMREPTREALRTSIRETLSEEDEKKMVDVTEKAIHAYRENPLFQSQVKALYTAFSKAQREKKEPNVLWDVQEKNIKNVARVLAQAVYDISSLESEMKKSSVIEDTPQYFGALWRVLLSPHKEKFNKEMEGELLDLLSGTWKDAKRKYEEKKERLKNSDTFLLVGNVLKLTAGHPEARSAEGSPQTLDQIFDVKDVKKETLLQVLKNQILDQYPILRVMVSYQDSERIHGALEDLISDPNTFSLLQHLEMYLPNGMEQDVVGVIRKALLVQYGILEKYISHFSKLDLEDNDQVKKYLNHSKMRKLMVKQFPGFAQAEEELEKLLGSKTGIEWFCEDVSSPILGIGFLGSFGIFLVSFIPGVQIPAGIMLACQVFMVVAYPFVVIDTVYFSHKYFIKEPQKQKILEDLSQTTITENALVDGSTAQAMSQRLKTGQFLYVLGHMAFLKLELRYHREMLLGGYHLATRSIGPLNQLAISQSLRRIGLSSTGSLTAHSEETIAQSYLRSIAKILSPEELKIHIQKNLDRIQSDVASHIRRWGETPEDMAKAIQSLFVPRHPSKVFYFTSRSALTPEFLLAERQALLRSQEKLKDALLKLGEGKMSLDQVFGSQELKEVLSCIRHLKFFSSKSGVRYAKELTDDYEFILRQWQLSQAYASLGIPFGQSISDEMMHEKIRQALLKNVERAMESAGSLAAQINLVKQLRAARMAAGLDPNGYGYYEYMMSRLFSGTHYHVLGVSQTASEKEIQRAYRSLSRRYHPDFNPGDATAEQKFKTVAKAYEVLRDPASRAAYDLSLVSGASGTPQSIQPLVETLSEEEMLQRFYNRLIILTPKGEALPQSSSRALSSSEVVSEAELFARLHAEIFVKLEIDAIRMLNARGVSSYTMSDVIGVIESEGLLQKAIADETFVRHLKPLILTLEEKGVLERFNQFVRSQTIHKNIVEHAQKTNPELKPVTTIWDKIRSDWNELFR